MRLPYLRLEDCSTHYQVTQRQVESFAPRNQGSWYQHAYALIRLANLAYALGRPLSEVGASLRESIPAFEQLFSMRGQTYCFRTLYKDGEPLPREQVFSDGYTSVESFQAGLVSLIVEDAARARSLVELAGHSPGAEEVAPDSDVCSSNQQTLSHAFNALLAEDLDQARREALKVTVRRASELERQIAATITAVAGPGDVAGELEALVFYHQKHAKRRNNWTDASLYLCLPALGLASLAVQRGRLQSSDLSEDSPYAPWALLQERGDGLSAAT